MGPLQPRKKTELRTTTNSLKERPRRNGPPESWLERLGKVSGKDGEHLDGRT